jgi:hypothetical protein
MEQAMPEKSANAQEREMSALSEASYLLREIAGPGEAGELKKAAWSRAMRKLSGRWTYNRVRDLWREERRARVSAEELAELRRIAGAKAGNDKALADDLEKRLDVVERMLFAMAQQDQEFVGEMLNSLRSSVGALRRSGHAEG